MSMILLMVSIYARGTSSSTGGPPTRCARRAGGDKWRRPGVGALGGQGLLVRSAKVGWRGHPADFFSTFSVLLL